MAVAAAEDVVWAIHTFEAENPDEISFRAGEAIVVIERDDMFSDGWWSGRNAAGQIGLFPESYTQKTKPSRAATNLARRTSQNAKHNSDVLQTTMSEVDHALQQQQVRSNGSDRRSIRSTRSRQSLRSHRSSQPDDAASFISQNDNAAATEQDPAQARQTLAARAKAQIEKAVGASKEKARTQQLDDDSLNGDYGNFAIPVPGLELSDESEAEEDQAYRIPGSNPARAPTALPIAAGEDDQEALRSSAFEASGYPLPSSGRDTPLNSSTTTQPTAQRKSSISSLLASAMGQNGNRSVSPSSPMLSNGSRKSRKSTEADVPPVPPVPAEVPSPSPSKGQTDVLGLSSSRRSVSSRRSSTSSNRSKRSKSISGQRSSGNGPVTSQGASAAQQVSPAKSPLDRSSLDTFRNAKSLTVKVTEPAQTSGTVARSSPIEPQSPGKAASALRESLRTTTPSFQSPVPKDAPFNDLIPASQTANSFYVSTASSNTAGTPVSATSDSRPGSQLDHSLNGGPTSVRTADTSPRSSLNTKHTFNDPRRWNVEQVIEWGKTRSFDAITLHKFAEHEISGDVLLEMDINTLKEIDLPAFGRRVHIYNGIKDLKRQVENAHSLNPASAATPAVSPTMSGYEPDTPSTRANFSPREGYTPSGTARSSIAQAFSPSQLPMTPESPPQPNDVVFTPMPDVGSPPADSSYDFDQSNEMLHGLGLREQDSPEARSAAMGKAATLDSASPSKSARSATTHKRSHTDGTVGTYNTAYTDSLARVAEDDAEVLADRNAVTDSEVAYEEGRTRVIPRGKNESQASLVSNKAAQKNRRSWLARDEAEDTGRLSQSTRSEKASSGFFTTAIRRRIPAPRVSSSIYETEKPSIKPNRRMSSKIFNFGSSSPSASAISPRSISEPVESGRKPSNAAYLSTPTAPALERSASDERAEEWRGVHDGHLIAAAPNPVQQIGKPELDGWLRKKGDRYNTWKLRYVIVKNAHVYFLKSPKETKIKGWIPISGYKVVPDADTARGFYGFKLCHATLPWHYFSSDDPLIIRKFMKALMKSSIKRDHSQPVYQSSNIPTMPLEEAQAMFPPPRPPSPTSRARAQKARMLDINPNSLTPKDAQILMSLQKSPSQVALNGPSSPSMERRGSKLNMLRTGSMRSKSQVNVNDSGPTTPIMESPSTSPDESPFVPKSPASKRSQFAVRPEDAPLLHWVNSKLSASSLPATSFASSFRSGDLLYSLLKTLSGQRNQKLEQANFQLVDLDKGDGLEMADPVFDLFDWMLELKVDTVDTSIADVLRGDDISTARLVQSFRNKFDRTK